MKKIVLNSLLLLFTFNFLCSQTYIKNDVYEVLYSEKFQQPLTISYEYPMYPYLNVMPLKITTIVDGVGYPDPFKEIKEWQVPEHIVSSDEYDYNLPFHRGHLVPAGSFKYSEHQRFIYSYLNCAIMHKDLNQGVWKTLENRERKLSENYSVNVEVTLLFSGISNTVDAGATIPSSFRKKIEYRKKGKMDFKNPAKIITEIYEFPNNESVKNTDLNSYKVKSLSGEFSIN